MLISPDLPITKADEDALNRKSFAQSLAKTILQYSSSSSFSIGLYGEWGSGKTSLLNMVLEAVDDNDVIILRFNPWLCSDPKQLITQFFKQMAAAIKLKKPLLDTTWELIDQYGEIFEIASYIPTVGNIVATLGKTIAKEANNRVEQRTGDLQASKNQIVDKLAKDNLKIVVSIDDIDRLSEEEIIAVFQLIKALADFPNTIYILAFDYDVVVHALSKVQHGNGKEYLEKIIQVPFEIPAPNMMDIFSTFYSKLDTILMDAPEERFDKIAWAELLQYGLKKYIKSIRDVIRYTNVFMLKYDLLKDETDLVDLLGLTALQVFEPMVYSKLSICKEALCGAITDYGYELRNAEVEKIKKAISLLIDDEEAVANKEATINTLKILFPKINTGGGVSHRLGRIYSHRNFLVNKNIAAPECFDRYFALSLESDAIPAGVIKYLIYEADVEEFCEGIQRLYLEGKIIRFLDEIDAYTNQLPPIILPKERASIIITGITQNWHSFDVDDRKFLSIPFAWRLIYCIEPLLRGMDIEDRCTCIRTIFNSKDVQPSTLGVLLDEFEKQQGRFTEAINHDEDAIFTLETVYELEEIFKQRALETLDSGEVFKQRHGLNFLWLLEQLDAEQFTTRKKKLITDDISLVKVIGYCISNGTVASKIVQKVWTLNRQKLEEFIDIDEAYQRIKDFAETAEFYTLPEEDKIITIAFILIMEQVEPNLIVKDRVLEDTVIKKMSKLK